MIDDADDNVRRFCSLHCADDATRTTITRIIAAAIPKIIKKKTSKVKHLKKNRLTTVHISRPERWLKKGVFDRRSSHLVWKLRLVAFIYHRMQHPLLRPRALPA